MSEWQPIETALRDGTIIDVWLGDCDDDDLEFYCNGGTKRATDWYFENGKFRPKLPNGNIIPVFVKHTHWQPLPEPPKD